MHIKIWNAFASNNSGSYTLVGSFGSAEQAIDVARRVQAVIEAHQAWFGGNRREPSPLARFAAAHGLSTGDEGRDDDWPDPGWASAPQVVAAARQVMVHVEQTVTMPRAFGEFIYKNGGRVDAELEHAHHPVVAVFSVWSATRDPDAADRVDGLQETLRGGALDAALQWPDQDPPATPLFIVPEDHGGVLVGAVFFDLVAGVALMRRVVEQAGLTMRVRVFEAIDEAADPFAELRRRGG